MCDNINNELNQDMDDNQEAPNHANDLAVDFPNEAESLLDDQSNFSAIVDYYLLSNNVPQPPIGMDITLNHQIETGTPITFAFTGGHHVTITTASNQVDMVLSPPHDPGRVHVQIDSPGPNSRLTNNSSNSMAFVELCCGKCLTKINQLEHMRATTCGHVFCDSCLQQALSEKANCPKCDKPEVYNNSIRLFWCGHFNP
ncbi:E3 ubiquitin-protein ligase complex slx8-rfp subunit slx8-like [Drosophila obscura]|uniref:E3 ubiquitin-protein ligase complex slx8-rfp subunit slx8-like n=1 Tax=Drosophila obscura TaxID=7282 RepID=UPI000BA088AC|nr:E3 ubiquitin-protein ligase complex slx8-rfp subunit slx8-like [Drosophila obscura]